MNITHLSRPVRSRNLPIFLRIDFVNKYADFFANAFVGAIVRIFNVKILVDFLNDCGFAFHAAPTGVRERFMKHQVNIETIDINVTH